MLRNCARDARGRQQSDETKKKSDASEAACRETKSHDWLVNPATHKEFI
jgi:hypothetical protein